ncbi:Vacuolar protein sorting-associated protein 37A [Mortierella sp. AD094]|nr:Vacuolar protein sorting-associated protein 37A [Mortierella sp. AD094]
MDRIINSANWGRKNANEHDSSPRRKQIESLFMELTQLRVVPNDDSRFQLTLQLASSPESPHTSSSTPHLTRTTSSPATATTHSSGSPSTTGGVGNSTATLTIYLPPGFPEEEPKITIQPTVRHLWVDGTVTPCAVTGHERLMPGGWSTHANLGRIVKEIVTNIQRTGVLVGGEHSDAYGNNGATAATLNSFKNNNGGSASNNNAIYDEYSHKPPPPIPGNRSKSLGQFSNHSPTPTFSNANGTHNQATTVGGSTSFNNFMSSSSVGESQHAQIRPNTSGIYSTTVSPEARIVMELSVEQIEEYLESPLAFEHFFDQLEVVVNSRTLKREWWHGNDNVSRRNLQLEAEMLELQKSTSEGYQVAMQLRKTLEEKLQQQQDALWRFKPETLQSKLRSAAAESDELSESIAQSFLEGKLDQEGFIRQYRDLRKVYHLREMKNERLGPILRNHPSSISGGSNSSGAAAGSGQDGAGSILKVGTGTGKGGLGLSSGLGSGGAISGGGGGGGPGSGNGSAGGSGSGSNGEPWVVL